MSQHDQASAQLYVLPTVNNEKYVIDAMMNQTLQKERMFTAGFVTFLSKSYKALSVSVIFFNKHFTYFIQLKEG